MNIFYAEVIRAILPKFIGKRILAKAMRTSILKYYDGLPGPHSEEIESVLGYLRVKPLTVFPYHFNDQYVAKNIVVYDDKEKGLRYVLLDGKRLYFKRKWSRNRIRKTFNGLLKEQDRRCPHCYENDDFRVVEGDVLLDIGAAEGNFSLSVVEKASRIVLFESNDDWIEALQATFEPWKHKVQIVNKFVGDVSNQECTTLDDYILPGEPVSFLKIDIEGAESQLLSGCKRILREQRGLKVAICTYHKQEDEHQFKELFAQNGFETSHSDGFMFLYHDRKIGAPFLRRGLIRATKFSEAV
jgi:hypothetical protein